MSGITLTQEQQQKIEPIMLPFKAAMPETILFSDYDTYIVSGCGGAQKIRGRKSGYSVLIHGGKLYLIPRADNEILTSKPMRGVTAGSYGSVKRDLVIASELITNE